MDYSSCRYPDAHPERFIEYLNKEMRLVELLLFVVLHTRLARSQFLCSCFKESLSLFLLLQFVCPLFLLKRNPLSNSLVETKKESPHIQIAYRCISVLFNLTNVYCNELTAMLHVSFLPLRDSLGSVVPLHCHMILFFNVPSVILPCISIAMA